MRARFVNEKFSEKSDPIHDMGIGAIKKIETWAKTGQRKESYDTFNAYYDSYNIYEILLSICIVFNKLDYAEFLLKNYRNKINISGRNETFLRLAVFNHKFRIAKLLIDYGASLEDAKEYAERKGENFTRNDFSVFKDALKNNSIDDES